jgi:hypothetical protein
MDSDSENHSNHDKNHKKKLRGLQKVTRALEQIEKFVRHPVIASQGYGTFQGISLQPFFHHNNEKSNHHKVKKNNTEIPIYTSC